MSQAAQVPEPEQPEGGELGNPFAGIVDQDGNVIGGPAAAAQAGAEETDAGGKSLFDPATYDDPELQLPQIDGKGIDKIRLKLVGAIELDRSSKDDVALFRKLRVGSNFEARVSGRVMGLQGTEADLDSVTGIKALKVDGFRRLEPEEL
ncbi:MAG: hypothetical protein ACM33U_09190 [Solirubrobacterales bacterium]|nr:hypothetical protein [Solirubrobacterales bacterium]